jgi:hypothetical protein
MHHYRQRDGDGLDSSAAQKAEKTAPLDAGFGVYDPVTLGFRTGLLDLGRLKVRTASISQQPARAASYEPPFLRRPSSVPRPR